MKLKTIAKVLNVLSLLGSILMMGYILIMRFTLCNICASEDPTTAFDASNRMWLFITFPIVIFSVATAIMANKKLNDHCERRDILLVSILRVIVGVAILAFAIFIFIQYRATTLYYGLSVWLWMDYIWYFIFAIISILSIPAGIMMLCLKDKDLGFALGTETIETAEEYVEEEVETDVEVEKNETVDNE